jgi:hypothetical protein
MIFQPAKCPTCGELPRGTVEKLMGCAELMEPDEDGQMEYSGTTDIWWDEQHTLTDDDGTVCLCCLNGHDWWATCSVTEEIAKGRA